MEDFHDLYGAQPTAQYQYRKAAMQMSLGDYTGARLDRVFMPGVLYPKKQYLAYQRGGRGAATGCGSCCGAYPNPCKDYFNISLSNKKDGKAVLYDLKGVALEEAELVRGLGTLNTGSHGEGFTATEKVFISR